MDSALGRIAAGVAVVSTVDAGGVSFAACSGPVARLSADPPLLLLTIPRRARAAAYFSWPRFAVSLLGTGQTQAAAGFAAGSADAFEWDVPEPGADGQARPPRVRGAVGSFECSVWTTYDGGDHVIVVGQVLGADVPGSSAQDDGAARLLCAGAVGDAWDEAAGRFLPLH